MRYAEGLTRREERDLVTAVEGGDEDACRRLVEAFLPAITSLARRVNGGGTRVEREELLQEGVAGLLVAARRYDTSLNIPFWTYASFWVRKAMQELVAELTRPVALSDRAVRDLARIRRARTDHVRAHGAEPTDQQLSRATGLSPGQLESLQATERPPRAMEERLKAHEEAAATVGETIVDPVAERAYDHVLDEIEIREVRDVAGRLDGRERVVIHAHFGLGQPPQTLDEIGTALALTPERARQIEVGALTKLRARLLSPLPRRRDTCSLQGRTG